MAFTGLDSKGEEEKGTSPVVKKAPAEAGGKPEEASDASTRPPEPEPEAAPAPASVAADEPPQVDLDAIASQMREERGLGETKEAAVVPGPEPEAVAAAQKEQLIQTVKELQQNPDEYIPRSKETKKPVGGVSFAIIMGSAALLILGVAAIGFNAMKDEGGSEESSSSISSTFDRGEDSTEDIIAKIRGRKGAAGASPGPTAGSFDVAGLGSAEPEKKRRRGKTRRRRPRKSRTLVEEKNMNNLDSALEDRFGGRPTLPGYEEAPPPTRRMRDDSPIGVYVRKEDPKSGANKLGVPSLSFLDAVLRNKIKATGGRNLALAVVSKDFAAGGNVLVPKGTKIVGSAKPEDDRVQVRFRKLVFADGREIKISAIAMMPDESEGLAGRVRKTGGGGNFKGDLAGVALDTASEVLPGGDSLAGRLGNRAGQAGLDHVGSQTGETESSSTVITVPSGMRFKVFGEEGF